MTHGICFLNLHLHSSELAKCEILVKLTRNTWVLVASNVLIGIFTLNYVVSHSFTSCFSTSLRGYCTPGPYFWRFCVFYQKINQLWTKYPMILIRTVPKRNSKIAVLFQNRPWFWSSCKQWLKSNIFHVLIHKSITTWPRLIPVQ